MHEDLRRRLCRSLGDLGVDLYIGGTPANIRYLSGYNGAFIDLSWQMTGTDLVVLPVDETLPPALIVSEYCADEAGTASDISDIRTYPMWTENRPFSELSRPDCDLIDRPEQYDPEMMFGLVREIAWDRGIEGSVIGCDLALMKHGTFRALRSVFPDSQLVDCEAAIYDVRSIKHPEEIARLRGAARLFDIGVDAAFENVREGATPSGLRAVFEAAVRDAVSSDASFGDCERSFVFPHIGRGASRCVRHGDIVKLDCGVRLDGYWSDACRHGVFGEPTDDQHRVHDALHAGFAAGLDRIHAGAVLRDVYAAILETVRCNGLPGYSRGHFGHSIGLDDQIEEPPFIGPNETVLKENMVLCLEVPCYPDDVGGFNIEDMLLVTKDGAESLTNLDRGLRRFR